MEKFYKKIKLQDTLVILTADHGEFIPAINHEGEIISDFGLASIQKILWKIEAHIPSFLLPIRNKLYAKGRKIIKQNKTKKNC